MDELQELLQKVKALNEDKKYAEAIALLPDNVLEQYNSADLYAEKALACYRTGKKDLSNQLAEAALLINPENAKALHYKGNYYYNQNKYDKAINAYNIAIKTDPNFAHPYYGLGSVYDDLKEYDKAIEAYNIAIKADPNFAHPYNGLGNVYDDLKEYDKAIEAYNIAIKIDPNFAYPYNGLGNVYNNKKEYDKAIEAYNIAIKIDPNFAGPYNGLGNVYYNKKEYNKAIEAYNVAIETDPDFTGYYYNRALAYDKTNNSKNAIADFKKYLTLTENKTDFRADYARDRIEELEKSLGNPEYNQVSDIVEKIKDLLLFTDNCVTHYTGLKTAQALILGKSPFRLSEGAFLNDTSEGRQLFKFLHEEDFTAIKLDDTVATPFAQKPFIGSFVSETKHDDLTLWRMYGKEDREEAKGCAVTLERETFIESIREMLSGDKPLSDTAGIEEELRFYRVAYYTQNGDDNFIIPGANDKEQELNECMKMLRELVAIYLDKKKETDKQDLIELLNTIAYLFKSVEYQYEHELRLVVKGVGFKKHVDTNSLPPKVYIELVDITPTIRKITLGPKVEKADEWAAAFHYSYDKEENSPEIVISHLPFK